MKGVFFVQLHNYITEKNGEDLWKEYLKKTGVHDSKLYFSNQQYKEEEFFKIIKAAIQHTGQSSEKFLEGFGAYMSTFFFEMYNPLIKKGWKTLDVLEHIEEYNYHILQAGDTPAQAGKFETRRIDSFNLTIIYSSPRKLCPVVVGLIKGIAAHYNEKTSIKQTRCCLEGDVECHFHISLVVGLKEKRNLFK